MTMTITEEKKDGFVVVALNGKLDATNAPELQGKLLGLIDGGSNSMVIDCSALDYVSSAGLRVFLMTAQKMEETDGKLGLAGVQELIKDVFDMAGFDVMFEFYPSPAEAISGLA